MIRVHRSATSTPNSCNPCATNNLVVSNGAINHGSEVSLVWHKQCFRCCTCCIKLDLRYKVDHEKLYCEPCYIKEILTLAGLESLACYTDKEGITYVDLDFTPLLASICESLLQLRIRHCIFTINHTLHPEVWHLKGKKKSEIVPETVDVSVFKKIKVSMRDRRGYTSEKMYAEFVSNLLSFTPSIGFVTLKFQKKQRFHEKFVCFLWLPEDCNRVEKLLYGCSVGNIRRKVSGISKIFTFRRKEELELGKVIEQFNVR